MGVLDDSQDNLQNNSQDNTQDNSVDSSVWQELLGDLAEDPSIKKFKNPQDLAKSYIELQKLIGKQKPPVPSSPDEYPDFEDYNVLFETPEEYKEFKKIMHEIGLAPEQYQKLYETMKGIVQTDAQQSLEARQEMYEHALSQLSEEWGEDFQRNVGLAQRLYNTFPDTIKEQIQTSGLDINPDFIKLLVKFAEHYKEDEFAFQSYSPAEAKQELESILSDKSHPYWDKYHPQHQAAVDKVENLYKLIYGS